jgi:hypothetical protein
MLKNMPLVWLMAGIALGGEVTGISKITLPFAQIRFMPWLGRPDTASATDAR